MLVPGGIGGLIGQALAQGAAIQGMRRLRGEVLVNGQPARTGTLVKPGDTVTTGPKSYATFVIGQDAFLVRGDSKVELGGSNVLVDALRLITGKVLSVYAPGKGPRRLESVTVTVGIRGTGAYMESSSERTYFCLCYGEAEIVPLADSAAKEVVRTTHHESPRYIYPAGAANIVQKAPVVNHKDDELILLESLVGRKPPFVDMDEYKSGVRY
jgi:hypothetical protein